MEKKKRFFSFPKKKHFFWFDGLTLTLTFAPFPSPFGLDLRTTDRSGLGDQDGYGVYQVSSSRFRAMATWHKQLFLGITQGMWYYWGNTLPG